MPQQITPEQVATMFPHASKSTLAANAVAAVVPAVPQLPTSNCNLPTSARKRTMNKTESAFAAILEARKARGEIISYQYEGVTLRWSDGARYTPDFICVQPIADSTRHEIVFYETKGGHLFPGAKRRFKEARDNHPWAQFEMWQKKSGTWTRLL